MSEKERLYQFRKGDIPRGTGVLKDAFKDDPVWNKLFRGEPEADKKLLAFFEVPLRHCLAYGKVFAPSENLEGIAAWLPGGKTSPSVWRMIRSGSFGAGLRMGANVGRKMGKIFRPLEAMKKERMKGREYLYLYIIGVAPAFQGQGFGGMLIRALIEEADRSGLPLYLDTETEENVRLYEKYGFTVVKQITLPLLELPMWGMVREPRGT